MKMQFAASARAQFSTALILAAVVFSSAQNPSGKPLPDPHKHVVAVHEEPWKTDLAPDVKMTLLAGLAEDMRDSIFSPNGRWVAFVFSAQNEWARVGFHDLRNGHRYQLVNLPLDHRPITDLVWIDSTLAAFDRWSQPHYGMHYVVDVQSGRLVLAAPFPDEDVLRRQRDTLR